MMWVIFNYQFMWKHVLKTVVARLEDAEQNVRWVAYTPALIDDGAMFVGFTREEAINGLQPALESIVQQYIAQNKPLPAMNEIEQVSLDNLDGHLAMNNLKLFQEFQDREQRSKKGEKFGLRVFMVDSYKGERLSG